MLIRCIPRNMLIHGLNLIKVDIEGNIIWNKKYGAIKAENFDFQYYNIR